MNMIYLAGAISGTTDYIERFAEARDEVKQYYGVGVGVISPTDNIPTDLDYEAQLEMCFGRLNYCDTICLLDGWENSRGANREYGYARGRGLNVVFQKDIRKELKERTTNEKTKSNNL